MIGYSVDGGALPGCLEFIRSLFTCEATDAGGLGKAFREALDDCIELRGAEGYVR